MSRHRLSEVYVITQRHSDGYRFDTSVPEEVFTTRVEADTAAEASNKTLPATVGKDLFFVETLDDRLDTIRDECRCEGSIRPL
jgi:hypothetical protein